MRQKYFLLFLILTLGAFLYFYKLSQIPPSVYDDEATVGYNAFSILTSLKDEYGKTLPISFRFFSAYTPPLYVYLIVPLIHLFSLNAFSIRLLSALSTLIGIIIVCLLIQEFNLFKKSFSKIIGSLLFTITPWVVFNARVGYEVTLGYIVFTIGALFLWKGTKKQKLSFYGLLLLSLSTYIAHTERYLVPIYLFLFLIIFRKVIFIKKNYKSIIKIFLIILITQIPNLFLVTTKSFWVKNSSINTNFEILFHDFINQLFTYFSPKTIFGATPDINLQHTIPNLSLFYSWMVIPFFIGLYQLFINIKKPESKYILLMFFTAPIPGSLSGHFISVQRVLTLIIPMIIIITLGLDFIYQKINPIIINLVLTGLFLISLTLLWRGYFIFLPKERAVWWSYGYEQLTQIIREHPDKKFLIDNSRNERIYMLILYYTQHSPNDFHSNFSSEFIKNYYSNPPFNSNYKIGNVTIRPIKWGEDTIIDQIIIGDNLAISDKQAIEHCLDKKIEIKDPTGNVILIGYQTNPQKKIIEVCSP